MLFRSTRFIAFFALFVSLQFSLFAQETERHEMTNSSVTINAVDYRSSRNLEKIKDGSKDFIKGKNKVYDNAKGKELSALGQPYAEYAIRSKMAGGRCVVTVTYKIDKDELKKDRKKNRQVRLAVDSNSPVVIDLKNNSSGYSTVSQDFDLAFLRGKNHTVKLWLPSKGVMVDKVTIRRKIFK